MSLCNEPNGEPQFSDEADYKNFHVHDRVQGRVDRYDLNENGNLVEHRLCISKWADGRLGRIREK